MTIAIDLEIKKKLGNPTQFLRIRYRVVIFSMKIRKERSSRKIKYKNISAIQRV